MEFRHDLAAAMKGIWLLTWHEDHDVNPGVPDLSFVMKGGEYETGWIELKANVLDDRGRISLGVESSQHQWMELHAGVVPCYFLVRVSGTCYLIPGTYHRSVGCRSVPLKHLEDISDVVFPMQDTRRILHDVLKRYTLRGRYGRTG